ncbi:hypothetical protein [Microbacterium sp. Leaf151]|uniref:hypothetical protein n=1 Tax=Microbacterium sp. Leaf151 TaxID=1736276 RepID=UPI0006F7EA63|nr:hypothetical protein [Microbacterium sp. Leaf151]KQR25798.1 hypothetical protein ASF76_00375 [Microbacterium sp. Leaf151]
MAEARSEVVEGIREFVRESLWHHATKRTRWLEQAQRDDARVHIGTQRAARSRMKQLHTAPRITYDVHQVRVRSDASICPVPAADPHSSTVEHRRVLASLEQDWDVVAYLNEHEDEGSISLSVRARLLEPLWTARAVTWFLYAPAPLRRRFVVFEKGWSTTQLYFR